MREIGRVRFVILFLLFFPFLRAKAERGVILTMEAPLFEQRSWQAPILQRVRKGEVLYIHPFHFLENRTLEAFKKKDPYYSDTLPNGEDVQGILDPDLYQDFLDLTSEENEFYATLDKNGQRAYIPKRYVKLITNDNRENRPPSIRPFHFDPTDYRQPEPLPKNYPLAEKSQYRGSILMGSSTLNTTSYAFPQPYLSKDYGIPFEFSAIYSKRAGFDSFDRVFFGGFGTLQNTSNQINFSGVSADESTRKLGVGPYFSYDTFTSPFHRFTFFGGILILWKRVNYIINDTLGNLDNRYFLGFAFGPRIGLLYQYVGIFPEVDLIVGTSLNSELAHTLESSDPITISRFWNSSNASLIEYPFSASLSVFIGLQSF